MTNAKTTAKILFAIAAVAAATFAGAASAATPINEQWGGEEPIAQGPALSRAEVQADLNLWNRAGLGQANAGDRTPDADPAYQANLAQYRRMRSGPEFVAEVRRLGGEVSQVAGQAARSNAN